MAIITKKTACLYANDLMSNKSRANYPLFTSLKYNNDHLTAYFSAAFFLPKKQ
jgi:hypothetical protein